MAVLFVGSLVGDRVAMSLQAQTLGDRFELLATVTVTPTPGTATPFDTLVKVNPQTGAQVRAGAVGAAIGVSQLDADPTTGILFGTDFSTPGVIYQIDPTTGVASIAGHVTARVNALAFSANGTLYGVDWSDFSTGNVLGKIDVTGQTFTPLMRFPAGVRVDAIDFAPGVPLYPDGLLYAVYVQPDPFQQWLVALDVDTQSVISRTPLRTTFAVGDMDYAADGFIYHSNFSQGLFRIDPRNPVQELVGFGQVGAAGGLASVSATASIRVDIDVKPGAFPNVINPCSAGVLPVAILSTKSFDASTVNPATVLLNNAGTRVAGKSGKAATLADVDGDGDLDLLIHVLTSNIGNHLGDATVTLTGHTFGGTQIVGTDTVEFVGPTTASHGLRRAACPRWR